jgi:hypothetical protein
MVFHKGEKRSPQSNRTYTYNGHEVGGFKCEVSTASSDLSQEVAEAIQFLTKYEKDLRQLASAPGVEAMTLDFGYSLRIDDEQCIVQFDFLPPELLKLCGSLNIGIELSLYPAS